MEPAGVLLGLGANLGDPIAQLRGAVDRLGALVALQAVSSVYRTEPVGFRNQPPFYNLALRATTRLEPEELLAATLRVERELGRERPFANAPRSIDIDLLAHGERIVDTPDLVLPHPRLHRRAFVLVPLREIAPEWRHPVLGLTPEEMLRRENPAEWVERWGPLGGSERG